MENQPDKCAQGNFFGRTEEQLAQNLTKFFHAKRWLLNHSRPTKIDCKFFDVVGKEGVRAGCFKTRCTNKN